MIIEGNDLESVCGLMQERRVCLSCEFLGHCSWGKAQVGSLIVSHHPDKTTVDYLFCRGEFDTVMLPISKKDAKVESQKYRLRVEFERKQLGLS